MKTLSQDESAQSNQSVYQYIFALTVYIFTKSGHCFKIIFIQYSFNKFWTFVSHVLSKKFDHFYIQKFEFCLLCISTEGEWSVSNLVTMVVMLALQCYARNGRIVHIVFGLGTKNSNCKQSFGPAYWFAFFLSSLWIKVCPTMTI